MNAAALSSIPDPNGLQFQIDLKRAIRQLLSPDEQSGVTECVVEHEAGSIAAILVRLEYGFALLPKSSIAARANQVALDNLLVVARDQLVEQVASFLDVLRNLLDQMSHGEVWLPSTDSESFMLCLDRGNLFAHRLDSLLALVGEQGLEPLRASDRILLKDSVEEALSTIDGLLMQRKFTVQMTGFDQPIGSLYGSRVWLVRALRECFLEVLEHAPTGMNVVLVKAVQHGAFVMVSISTGVLSGWPGRTSGAQFHRVDTTHRMTDHRSLGMAIAGRVIEQLGGRYRESDQGGGLELSLELPTGGRAPEAGLDPRQVEAYAVALANLMRMRSDLPQANSAAIHSSPCVDRCISTCS